MLFKNDMFQVTGDLHTRPIAILPPPPHNSFSRIDNFFASPTLSSLLSDAKISNTVISDHSPIIVNSLKTKLLSPSPKWRFPSYLADSEDFRQMLYDAWAEYASTNGAHITDPNLFLEAGKAFLRGKIISHTSHFKKMFPAAISTGQ